MRLIDIIHVLYYKRTYLRKPAHEMMRTKSWVSARISLGLNTKLMWTNFLSIGMKESLPKVGFSDNHFLEVSCPPLSGWDLDSFASQT